MKLASLDRIPFIMANSGYGLVLMSPLDPPQDKFKRWNPQEKVVKQALDLLDTHAYRSPRFFLNAAIEVRGDFYYFRLAPIIFAGRERSVKNKKTNNNNFVFVRDANGVFLPLAS